MLSREHPQKELSRDIADVFSINLRPFKDAILPGSLIEGSFHIKSLYPDKLHFIGDARGRGRIGLQLHTIDANTSRETAIQQLPVPFELEKDREETLIFHYDPPKEPGEYELCIAATQSRGRILPIDGNFKLRLKVEESTVDAIRSVFGEFEFTPDNWYYSSWFGYFYTNSFPWILSLDHGWLKVDQETQDRDGGIHFIDFKLGRWSTSRESYPVVTLGNGDILSFEQTRDDKREFRDMSGRMVSFETSKNETD